MTTFDIIKKLSKERGENPKIVALKLGFGENLFYKWQDASPTSDKLRAVADYFDVSTDYLLGRTDNPEIAGKDMHTNAMAAHYADGTRQLTKEQIQQLDEMTNALIAGFKAQNKKDDE